MHRQLREISNQISKPNPLGTPNQVSISKHAGEMADEVSILKLENGSTLVFDSAKAHSAVLDVSVGFGSAFEAHSKQGLAHFLEHTIFNGTKKHSKQEVFRLIDAVGGEINAFTLKQATRFYGLVLGKDFSRVVEVLPDSLENAVFDEKLLEIERRIILAELRQSMDEPEEFVFDKFLQQILLRVFGRRTIGTEESIKGITRKDLVQIWEKNYFPKNLLIGVTGSFEEKEICRKMEEAFSWNLKKQGRKKRFMLARAKHSESFFERKTEHAHICLGFPVMNACNAEEFLAFKLISAVLGGGLSSRLNEELREKRGLCYSVNALLQAEEDYGFFTVCSSTQAKNLEEMKQLILNELKKLKQGELSLKELNKAKNYVLGKELILRENMFKRTEQNIQCWQYFRKTVRESFELLQQLELDDIIGAAEKYIQTEKYGLSVLKPKARV